MSEIQRWEPENTIVGYNMKPCADGSFVLFDVASKSEAALRQQLADVSNERDGLRAKLECSQGDMRQADQVMELQRTQIADLEQSLEDSPHALASALCQKLATMRGGPIDWAEAIAITAIVTRLSSEEESRLLEFDAVTPAAEEWRRDMDHRPEELGDPDSEPATDEQGAVA